MEACKFYMTLILWYISGQIIILLFEPDVLQFWTMFLVYLFFGALFVGYIQGVDINSGKVNWKWESFKNGLNTPKKAISFFIWANVWIPLIVVIFLQTRIESFLLKRKIRRANHE